MVELAVMMPIIVILLLAVLQIGLLMEHKLLVHHVARETSRAAAIDPDLPSDLDTVASTNGLRPDRLTVTISEGEGRLVTARVEYQAPTAVPVVGLMIGDVTLASEVTMRSE